MFCWIVESLTLHHPLITCLVVSSLCALEQKTQSQLLLIFRLIPSMAARHHVNKWKASCWKRYNYTVHISYDVLYVNSANSWAELLPFCIICTFCDCVLERKPVQLKRTIYIYIYIYFCGFAHPCAVPCGSSLRWSVRWWRVTDGECGH